MVFSGAVDTIITTASGALGSASDLTVGGDGTVYVSDFQNHLIHRLAANGDPMPPLGREGEGPGELARPAALLVSGDTLTVVDVGNGRLQRLATRDGSPLGARTSPGPAAYGAVPSGDGWAAFPTLGMDTALVALFDPEDERVGLGRIEGEPSNMIRLRAMKAQIANGEVPVFFLNHAKVAFAPDGDVFVAAPARGSVARYSRDGTQAWSLDLQEPNFGAVRASFIEKNAGAEANQLFPLEYFVDIAAVDEELWLLMEGGSDTTRVVVVGADGVMVRRVEITGVSGAGAMAPDPARRALYLSIPDRAELLRVLLPREAFAS